MSQSVKKASVSKKSDHDRYRSASYGWTTLSARQSAADFAKSCGTYACTARFGVGVDAYIDPADCTVFTVICGEFATSRRADVGIGPYRVLREFTAAHRADRGVRPYASLGNPTQNRKTMVFDRHQRPALFQSRAPVFRLEAPDGTLQTQPAMRCSTGKAQ